MSEQDRNPARSEAETRNLARAAPVVRDEHSEAMVTRLIEQQAARIPSHWFLVAAFGALGASLGLELTGQQRWSRFVGMWTAPLLITGVYNKLVKALGPQ